MPTTMEKTESVRSPAPKRGGKMADLALVDEVPVWLEINHKPAATWMCTPDQLEQLVVGWLHGEGYIDSLSDLKELKPCATDLGFWVEIPTARVDAINAEERQRVLASGCGSVSVPLGDIGSLKTSAPRSDPPPVEQLRALFKTLFGNGTRYRDTGGIHAAALTDGKRLFHHAEDIGRHNAVDKVIGAALLEGRSAAGMGLLVTGRISAELAFKSARAGIAYVATPSVPSTLAAKIAQRSGVTLVGRAVSGSPHIHTP